MVVIAKKMQTPVNDEAIDLIVQGHMITDSLFPRTVYGNVHFSRNVTVRRFSGVQYERQNVRCSIQMAILMIQLPDVGVIDEYDRRSRMAPTFTPEHPTGNVRDLRFWNIKLRQRGFDMYRHRYTVR